MGLHTRRQVEGAGHGRLDQGLGGHDGAAVDELLDLLLLHEVPPLHGGELRVHGLLLPELLLECCGSVARLGFKPSCTSFRLVRGRNDRLSDVLGWDLLGADVGVADPVPAAAPVERAADRLHRLRNAAHL